MRSRHAFVTIKAICPRLALFSISPRLSVTSSLSKLSNSSSETRLSNFTILRIKHETLKFSVLLAQEVLQGLEDKLDNRLELLGYRQEQGQKLRLSHAPQQNRHLLVGQASQEDLITCRN